MKFRVCLFLLCLAFALQAQDQTQMNVAQLVDFIRSELALGHDSDKKIAAYIKSVQLTEKLDQKTITDLEAQGAQPRTVQALQELRDRTASLKSPAHDATYSPATVPDNSLSTAPATATLSAAAAPIPPPDSVKQQEILGLMRQYALSYEQNLPNYICVRVDRRYVDPNAGQSYRSIGTIFARVSYNEGQEKYRVYSVNGKFVDTDMGGVGGGGARSTGEFAGLMRSIFEPKSQADFGWDHWGTLRGRRMAVFNYFIDSGHSSYTISYGGEGADDQRIVTAYKGLVYADPNTGEIDRIKFIAVDIPRGFPVQQATEILDYDLVDISGQQYVVPMRALLLMSAGRQTSKNEVEFRDYRKFGTESVITYDLDHLKSQATPPPLDSSKIDEQPATAAQPSQAATQKAKAADSNPWALPSAPPPPPQ
ncbi:MAG: hypothetical protein JO270_15270 [Acidobacteriaceae bacterium]|nr:hypothetical protein [Acidobacteriaceae bacterium]MBV8571927.1 hypothetical protein [Acidobacteriaceae bacterium]